MDSAEASQVNIQKILTKKITSPRGIHEYSRDLFILTNKICSQIIWFPFRIDPKHASSWPPSAELVDPLFNHASDTQSIKTPFEPLAKWTTASKILNCYYFTATDSQAICMCLFTKCRHHLYLPRCTQDKTFQEIMFQDFDFYMNWACLLDSKKTWQ